MRRFIGILGAMILMLGLTGCAKSYRVDYDGAKFCFEGAKDSYREGEEVRLCFGLIATDTDYSFYVDGQPFAPAYSEKEGFILKFRMPDHDITVTFQSRNSMVDPEGA